MFVFWFLAILAGVILWYILALKFSHHVYGGYIRIKNSFKDKEKIKEKGD